MSVTFLILEQTITISNANALQNCKFSSSFSKRRRIVGDFYLGWKHADQNYLPNGLIWSKFDLQIFQAHFDEDAILLILDHFIINVVIRGKNTSFFKCRDDEWVIHCISLKLKHQMDTQVVLSKVPPALISKQILKIIGITLGIAIGI